jgi:MFS family permease
VGGPSFISRGLRTAWIAVALLWPVAMLNYLDRQMLASMKFSVMQDVPGIDTDAHWGLMLGQFKWVYAFLSPLGGLVADRFGRKRTIVTSLLAWSAVTWATGHANTFSQLLWTRTLMGCSEAFYFPAALALIADHHDSGTRSRAVGVHQMAVYVGAILGGFGGYAADAPSVGWRGAFHVAGLVGIAYALPLAAMLREAPRTQAHAAPSAPGSSSGVVHGLLELLRNRAFLTLVACFTLPALAAWVVRDWMPAILKQQFGIGQGMAGVSASLYWNVAAFAGVLLGGWLADTWSQRTPRGRTFTSALGIALIVPAMFGVGNAPNLVVAVSFLALFGLGWGLFDCNNMPILCQIARPGLRATGYGLMNLVSIACGGFADVAYGAMQDRGMPINGSFAIFAMFAVIAAVLMLSIRPTAADGGEPAKA